MSLEELNGLSSRVLDAAIAVHTALGPGLLESAYRACLLYELRKRGMRVEEEVPLRVVYDGMVMVEVGYKMDLVVEGLIVLELKAVEVIAPVHRAQLLSYLRLSGKRLGLLLNFNVARLKDGISRQINGY